MRRGKWQLAYEGGDGFVSSFFIFCGDFFANLLGQVQSPFEGSAFFLDFFLKERDGVDQLLRTRWASRNIDIDWDYLVHALDQSVIVEDAA